jgi:hypothetical protein
MVFAKTGRAFAVHPVLPAARRRRHGQGDGATHRRPRRRGAAIFLSKGSRRSLVRVLPPAASRAHPASAETHHALERANPSRHQAAADAGIDPAEPPAVSFVSVGAHRLLPAVA